MKITHRQLRQIIKEELEALVEIDMLPGPHDGGGSVAASETLAGQWMRDNPNFRSSSSIDRGTRKQLEAASKLIVSFMPVVGQGVALHDINMLLDDPTPDVAELSLAIASLVPGIGATGRAAKSTAQGMSVNLAAPDVLFSDPEKKEMLRRLLHHQVYQDLQQRSEQFLK